MHKKGIMYMPLKDILIILTIRRFLGTNDMIKFWDFQMKCILYFCILFFFLLL